MAEVSLTQVEKFYGTVQAVRSVSMDIADGEFVALVGPSGCGKSTLLRMIAGLETITGGDLSIGGQRVNEVPAKGRDIAMVFQNYALYPHMTVAQNMAFSLKIKGLSRADIDARVRQAAAIVGLDDYLTRLPRELSGGQRQRVAMGRAIVRDPAVFLFDEPLSNLDAKLRVQMRSEVKALHQRLATTTIYVTHDQIEAMTMADRIVVMNGGRIEQMGAPLALYDRPESLFVAGFIGSPAMNLLPGAIRDGRFVSDRGLALPVPPSAARDRPGVTYGIRPEDLSLVSHGVAAQVALVEPMGADTQVRLDAGGETLSAVLRDRVADHPGQPVQIGVPTGRVHLFDTESGRRLE
ncbi:ABC transporter ATP-binding protein [Frigidibacter sp. MR17.24]|uniref:ABC transporter ATP-binding protein n=1 Tax=Frigidibacter sp. MR17.24 TaxID=3127345 RepID=UPI0030130238